MPVIKQFPLPDAGEGLTEAEILTWHVAPGDTITVNQVICEIETAKAAVELPSPFAGVVVELLVRAGETVDVGTPIISVDTDPSGPAAPAPPAAPASEPAAVVSSPSGRSLAEDLVPALPPDPGPAAGTIGGSAPGGRTAVLVGYGPRVTSAVRRPRKEPAAPGPAPEPVKPVRHGGLEMGRAVERALAGPSTEPVRAKPPVRKLAKDLGVDLHALTPTGPGGAVTREDVERAASGFAGPSVAATVGVAAPGAPAAAGLPAAALAPASFGPDRERRVPIKGVRKHTAAAMVASAFTAPHVTEWVTLDVTRSMRLLERLRSDRELREVKLSPTVLAARALLLAVRRHPDVNATRDEAAQEIVVKEYVNLGIAAATPRGLVVPNVKDAGRLTLRQLAEAITALAVTAREGRTAPSDMAGGTITITNVGVFGVDGGTPILNPGEAAILCLGQVRELPWVHKGKVRPRQVLQLGLSFDHRLVDGELGSRVLADVARVLERPETALAWC